MKSGAKAERKMKICETCKHKICLKTGRPCQKLESILRKEGIYSADYIRPKMPSTQRGKGQWREIPFSMLDTEGWKKVRKDKIRKIRK